MPLDKPLCTHADIEAETRNDKITSLNGIDEVINLASRYVEEVTEKLFWNYDHTSSPFNVDKSCVVGHIVTLPFPVITLNSLTLNGDSVDLSGLLVEEGKRSIYRLTDDYSPLDWYSGESFFGKIEVTGTFGYTLDGTNPDNTPPINLPPSIRKAVALIASAWTGEYEIERVGFDGARETVLETFVPEEAKRLLQLYKPLKLDF